MTTRGHETAIIVKNPSDSSGRRMSWRKPSRYSPSETTVTAARTSGASESKANDARGVGVVAALEGGYDPARTGLGAAAVLRAMAGIELNGWV